MIQAVLFALRDGWLLRDDRAGRDEAPSRQAFPRAFVEGYSEAAEQERLHPRLALRVGCVMEHDVTDVPFLKIHLELGNGRRLRRRTLDLPIAGETNMLFR